MILFCAHHLVCCAHQLVFWSHNILFMCAQILILCAPVTTILCTQDTSTYVWCSIGDILSPIVDKLNLKKVHCYILPYEVGTSPQPASYKPPIPSACFIRASHYKPHIHTMLKVTVEDILYALSPHSGSLAYMWPLYAHIKQVACQITSDSRCTKHSRLL